MNLDAIVNQEHAIYVGRGATAIYLLLKRLNASGEKVIVPANLCYAAVFPVFYAGLLPQFCDVDQFSGNVTYQSVKDAITEDTVAAIIPHMYGNPVRELLQIADLCKKNNIYLIQDNASAMGISPKEYDVFTVADATVYSTGYSKTVDLGGGGVLSIRDGDVDDYLLDEKMLPFPPVYAEEELRLFSRIYRLLRNEGCKLGISEKIYSVVKDHYRDCFIYRIDQEERGRVQKGIRLLPRMIEQRRKAKRIYDESLSCILDKNGYVYSKGAVPWRYNILVEPFARQRLIRRCLELNIPISDWYPSVLPVFGEKKVMPGVEWHENHILNFPLLISEEEIVNICRVILSELTKSE